MAHVKRNSQWEVFFCGTKTADIKDALFDSSLSLSLSVCLSVCLSLSLSVAGIVQLVGRPTENPRRNTYAGLSPRFWKGFFSQSQFSVQTHTSVQPPCAIACIDICVHANKSQTLTAIPLFGHTKILHTLTGMGSAALLCITRVRRPEISGRGNEVLKEGRCSWLCSPSGS